jgi:hypothetical protein
VGHIGKLVLKKVGRKEQRKGRATEGTNEDGEEGSSRKEVQGRKLATNEGRKGREGRTKEMEEGLKIKFSLPPCMSPSLPPPIHPSAVLKDANID